MIRTTAEISNENGYKKYNLFEIHENLESIIAEDYLTYASENFKKAAYCELMYKKNFYDKYDETTYKEVYERYINNEKARKKNRSERTDANNTFIKKTDSSVFDVFTYPKRIQSFTTNLLSNTMKNTFI